MQVPLQIVFDHIGQSHTIEVRVRKDTAKLEKFCDRITRA